MAAHRNRADTELPETAQQTPESEAVLDSASNGREYSRLQHNCKEATAIIEARVLGISAATQRHRRDLARCAVMPFDVLLLAETGAGKEVAARAITEASPRGDRPFVIVDFGEMSPQLIRAELYGHERGAFTGAAASRVGLLEQANGGCCFFDELGECPLEDQPALLRALEAREIRRVGANESRPLDIRVIAATHRDLWTMCEAGEFRWDLYYRFGVVIVRVPPLRERLEDIPLLFDHFLGEASTAAGIKKPVVSASLVEHLQKHGWPGNLRELRVVAQRIVTWWPDVSLDNSEIFEVRVRSVARRSTRARRPPGPTPFLDEHVARVQRLRLEYADNVHAIKRALQSEIGLAVHERTLGRFLDRLDRGDS